MLRSFSLTGVYNKNASRPRGFAPFLSLNNF